MKKDRLLDIIKLADESLRSFGIAAPRVAAAALNPHGGEGGLFGREEIDEIIPAVDEAAELGIDAQGPISADSVFIRAKEGEFDVVIAMFHDQGAIAMKMMGFGSVVTLLLGLPIIRTSVGHGTAFDIAGKNMADHRNLEEAVIVAAELAADRIQARSD
ncbi:MAG: 4-hydroxythreonine-4-phosphate dehydrogenase PdxA [Armatimonadetes bacterium]|nr:4-hydroxythreonine-4-phosphate dehydrogenase PdxA [Armatimonadota bacterium]